MPNPIKIIKAATSAAGLAKAAKKYDNALAKGAGKTKGNKAEQRALKAAQGKSLAPKGYKPDTEGRKQVKRFAAPLERANGKKNAMRMGAQTIDIGRSSLKIKKAPSNRGK